MKLFNSKILSFTVNEGFALFLDFAGALAFFLFASILFIPFIEYGERGVRGVRKFRAWDVTNFDRNTRIFNVKKSPRFGQIFSCACSTAVTPAFFTAFTFFMACTWPQTFVIYFTTYGVCAVLIWGYYSQVHRDSFACMQVIARSNPDAVIPYTDADAKILGWKSLEDYNQFCRGGKFVTYRQEDLDKVIAMFMRSGHESDQSNGTAMGVSGDDSCVVEHGSMFQCVAKIFKMLAAERDRQREFQERQAGIRR